MFGKVVKLSAHSILFLSELFFEISKYCWCQERMEGSLKSTLQEATIRR
jgi:hypothetical protein